MASDIESAIRQICEEKGLPYEAVMETIESALAAAYRKDFGDKMQNIEVEFDAADGSVKAFDVKTIVEDVDPEALAAMEERQAEMQAAKEAARAAGDIIPHEPMDEEEILFNPKTEIMISEAKVLKMSSEIGDVMRTELPVATEFGRMAAMTAKQVITQKLREAEREIVYNEFKEHEGEVLIGTVQRREGRVVLVDLGRTAGVLLPEDQMRSEQYNSGDRIKVHVREVSLGTRGPQILLSRTSEALVKALFELEIPEVGDGIVQIKGIAREAGARSKVAVHCEDDSIDPIGACIGQRGMRIQTIINELGGEKIDIIEWSADAEQFIGAALAPAKVEMINLDDEEGVAQVIVAQDQLSLAIGRSGQNVRLAAKLTGWKLNVAGSEEEAAEGETPEEDGISDAEEENIPATEEEIEDAVEEIVEETEEEIEEIAEEVAEEIEEAVEDAESSEDESMVEAENESEDENEEDTEEVDET